MVLAGKLGTLPLGYFSSRTTGGIKKVMHEDVEQLEEGLAHMIPDLIAGLTVPLLTLGVLFWTDWRMALATVALLPFAIGMYAYVAARSPEAKVTRTRMEVITARIGANTVPRKNWLQGKPLSL